MLFHITSQHNHETCEGSLAFKGVDVPPDPKDKDGLKATTKLKLSEHMGIRPNIDIMQLQRLIITMMFENYLAQQDICEMVKQKLYLLMILWLLEKTQVNGASNLTEYTESAQNAEDSCKPMGIMGTIQI